MGKPRNAKKIILITCSAVAFLLLGVAGYLYSLIPTIPAEDRPYVERLKRERIDIPEDVWSPRVPSGELVSKVHILTKKYKNPKIIKGAAIEAEMRALVGDPNYDWSVFEYLTEQDFASPNNSGGHYITARSVIDDLNDNIIFNLVTDRDEEESRDLLNLMLQFCQPTSPASLTSHVMSLALLTKVQNTLTMCNSDYDLQPDPEEMEAYIRRIEKWIEASPKDDFEFFVYTQLGELKVLRMLGLHVETMEKPSPLDLIMELSNTRMDYRIKMHEKYLEENGDDGKIQKTIELFKTHTNWTFTDSVEIFFMKDYLLSMTALDGRIHKRLQEFIKEFEGWKSQLDHKAE